METVLSWTTLLLYLKISSIRSDDSVDIVLGFIVSTSPSRFDEGNFRPAVDLAIRRVNQPSVANGYHQKFNISYLIRHAMSDCSDGSPVFSPMHAAELHYVYDVDGFVGHPCSYEMSGVADLASGWNLPVISGASTSSVLDNKLRFTTLTRSSFQTQAIANFLLSIFEKFDWVVCDMIFPTFGYYSILAGAVERTFLATGRKIKTQNFFDFENLEDLMKIVQGQSRIVILALKGQYVREVMIAAHQMGLINGDYVFISIEPFRNYYYFGNQDWQQGDEYDEIAKDAYEALLTIRLFEPDTQEYLDFQNELRRIEKEVYNRTRAQPDDRNFFANAFYDAVLLYSLAVNETLAEGGDLRDGYTITRRMWNRTFEGISGPVTINTNGDRDANYVLWDMTDTENGTFHVIFDYYGTTDVLVPSSKKKPAWPGGRTEAPPDAPFCGFRNENPECQEEINETRAILVTVAVTFVCMILLSGLVLYLIARRMSLNAELMKMSWMIKWNDLVFDKLHKSMHSHSVSMRELSTGAGTDYGGRSDETVAYYQGRLVLVTKINKEKVDLTREVLIELRNMKQLDQTNVVRFIGACIEHSNIATIQEYCSKGSLEDILQNDDLKLDWTFKCSLISDIIQGLHYIHGSDIGIHGYLTSETCFVDSRFVLKLGFHGLHLFRKDEEIGELSSKHMYRRLWASPESLRCDGRLLTKESDIYSAGIVLAEIITRLEPYENERNTMSVADILKRIRDVEDKPFRQVIPETDARPEVVLMIHKCTDEKPEIRPNTAAMMSTMRKINKDIKGGSNLLDNLLARMEQYATNLEKLVEERTAAFLEEKKKAERLLYEVLPKTVADQLKQGESVKPEDYDSVTIFFSDIVGFTAMSAQSTPMQVVALLNDLYTCFDGILSSFDVYKVETIGDAYMVVSGLPVRNGDAHAREIANMSLVLIDASIKFKIRHFPERKLMLRVGIHSGSCVAGVVGLKMPRYCLFGDTVNTASRMESNGEALKIHISQSTWNILMKLGGFVTEYRGEIELKGKGLQTTYWLISSDSKPVGKPEKDPREDGVEIPPAKMINVEEI